MWVFHIHDGIADSRFYYQFEGEKNTPALIMFTPSEEMLTNFITSISSINDQQCALFGSDGTPLLIPDSLSAAEQAALRNSSSRVTEGYQLLSGHTVMYRIRCEALPLVFVSLQQVGGAPLFSSSLLQMVLLSAALIALCIFISYQVFIKGITRRIIRLSDACESITFDQSGETSPGMIRTDAEGAMSLPSVEVMGQDEIGTLSESINHMIRRIGELSNLNAQEVRESQRTAYDMLAAQIHPHFIYNTLLSIYALCAQDVPKAQQVILDFSAYLQQNFTAVVKEGTVPFTEELEHTRSYLAVETARSENTLAVTSAAFRFRPKPEEIAESAACAFCSANFKAALV